MKKSVNHEGGVSMKKSVNHEGGVSMKKSVIEARAGLIPELGSDSDPSARVVLFLTELNAIIDHADRALDGDSNDAEHDALYSIREELASMSSDPDRRL